MSLRFHRRAHPRWPQVPHSEHHRRRQQEYLPLLVARLLPDENVLAALADLIISRGTSANIRSDNGSESIQGEIFYRFAEAKVPIEA